MSPLATSLRFLQTQSDARLVELSHQGHERAFEALVHRYRRELLAYCRRLTPGEATAEDVLQQGLLQAWVAIGRDTAIRDVRAWLYRIVHNAAISSIRRAGTDPVELLGTEGAGGADSEVERRLAAREALAGLAALPELQRRVMLSTALEGRSHEEIAALLGLTHGAVRGLIYRARAALRAAAAAVIPGPVIGWAARQEVRGGAGSSGFYEAVAGSGTAGLGGLLVKGSAIVATAGALATAAGLTPIQALRHGHHRAGAGPLVAARLDHDSGHAQPSSPGPGGSSAVRVSYSSPSGGSSAGGSASGGSTTTRSHAASALIVPAPPRRNAQAPSNGGGSSGPGGSGRSGGGGSGSPGGPPSGGSRGSSGGSDGGSSGGTDGGGSSGGSSRGSDGGSSGGSDGGSSGGTDGGTSGATPSGTTGGTTSGSPGGPDGGSSGGDGGDGGQIAQSGTGGGDHSGDGSDGGSVSGTGGD
jgi:RNA polymerase sigma factor (sigma-70 family)